MIQSLVREMPEDIRPISVTPPVRQQSSRAISQRKELPADPLSGIASSGPYSADPHTRLSEKAVLRGDWDLAIQEAGLALNENQDNARAMLMKSIAEAKGQVCGVVKTASARAYDSTGSTIEDGVELGTFLEISSFKANRTDMLAVSSFSRSDSVISGILIPLNDIEIDTRQLSSLSDDDKSALKQRAILLSSIDKLGSEQAALKAKLNPHADEYAKATAAYNAYFKKSANLAARRESASGDERMKIEDELRKLRAEGARAKREYEAVKDKCKAWNDDFSPSDNPEIQKLQENIDSLNNELRSLQDGRQP